MGRGQFDAGVNGLTIGYQSPGLTQWSMDANKGKYQGDTRTLVEIKLSMC